MKTLFTIGVLLVSISSSVAQSNDTTRVWRAGFYMSVVGQEVDLDDLNRELAQVGIPTLTSGLVGFSFGFTNRHRDQNSYGMAQFSYMSTFDDGNDAGNNAQLDLWKISVTGQYDVIPNEKWLIFPYLQLSTNLARLKVSSVVNTPSFQGSLSNLGSPDELVKRYSTGMFISGGIGAGIERRLVFPGSIGFIGFSAGYEISPQSEWQTEGGNYFLANSPAFQTNGLVFEFRFRIEINPNTDRNQEPQGIYKFFQ